jgi:hypothetical protein
LWSKEKESLLENHGLAQGWPMVNPSGVAMPMVGRKHESILAITSHFLVMISIFILCIIYWMDAMIECLCLWLSLAVFEKLLEMIIFFCKILYLNGL